MKETIAIIGGYGDMTRTFFFTERKTRPKKKK
jgi:hypothetical protein